MMNLVGQQVGNYKLLRLLGQGYSDCVYLGEHKYHRSYVAVKVQATNRWKTRGSNEVYMLSHVTHPHIVRILSIVRGDAGKELTENVYCGHAQRSEVGIRGI